MRYAKGTLMTPQECEVINKIRKQRALLYERCIKTKCRSLKKAWEKSTRALKVTRRRKCGKETPENENGGVYWKCAYAEYKKGNTRKRSSAMLACHRTKCEEWV